MRILLIRHGQSEANVNGRIQGPDDPLTDIGRAQARLLADYIATNITIHHLIASSLDRAMETAGIIAESTGLAIESEPDFMEIRNGDSVGMLWTDWRAANPDLAEVWGWDKRHADAGWAGGESGRDLYTRVFAVWDSIIARYRTTNDTVAIVTHGGVIAWLAARLNGDSLETWPAAYGDIANCSITWVDVSSDGEAAISRWNETAHLGDQYRPHLSPVIPPLVKER